MQQQMMKKIGWIAALVLLSYWSSAQEYGSAIGLRAGYGITATYKAFVSNQGAVEVFAGIHKELKGINAGVLYEHHFVLPVEGLQWYIGGGGQAFIGDGLGIGVSGAIGLDYAFANIPLNISLDWLPVIGLVQIKGFNEQQGGIAVRYLLN